MPRSRKRGRRAPSGTASQAPVVAAPPRPTEPPTAAAPGRKARPSNDEFLRRYQARAEERNVAARARLVPLAAGERPWPILVAVALTVIAALVNLVGYVTGTKIEGTQPGAASIVVFAAIMLVCAIGMWRLWYQAVLAFMVLLAIVVVVFGLLLVEASNVRGVVVGLVIVSGGGFLFWKLVGVLSRLQMPTRPER